MFARAVRGRVSLARAAFRSARKSDIPSSLVITASPSITNDAALMRRAASTIAGKRSAQSWPLRVSQPDIISVENGPVADIDLHKTTLLSHQITYF
jgi:hypothetical protein